MLEERIGLQTMVAVLTRARKPAKRSKIRPNELAGSSPATMYVVFILRESYS